MADRLLISAKRTVSKRLKGLEKAISLSWFLHSCLKYKVIPRTLEVKPPAGSMSQVSEQTANLYKNAAFANGLR